MLYEVITPLKYLTPIIIEVPDDLNNRGCCSKAVAGLAKTLEDIVRRLGRSPYHGYDGFAIFARGMDMTLNNPCWAKVKAPWLKATWGWLVTAAEWTVNAALGLLASHPLRLLGWFLIGSLAAWYCFS